MEAYRSGHNEPDSKSGCPHGHVSSNLTASANGTQAYSLSPIILLIAGVLCALCNGVPVSLIALFVQVFDITIGVNQMNIVSGTAGQGMCGTVESDMELSCTGKTQPPDDDTCREGSNPLRPANGLLPNKKELSADSSFCLSKHKGMDLELLLLHAFLVFCRYG